MASIGWCFQNRGVTLGSRLQHFKGDRVAADGSLNWKGAVYTPTYKADGFLESVQHRDGCIARRPEWASYINRTYDLVQNWCDMTDFFERKPSPTIEVWKLFLNEDKSAAARGPFSMEILKGQLLKE